MIQEAAITAWNEHFRINFYNYFLKGPDQFVQGVQLVDEIQEV